MCSEKPFDVYVEARREDIDLVRQIHHHCSEAMALILGVSQKGLDTDLERGELGKLLDAIIDANDSVELVVEAKERSLANRIKAHRCAMLGKAVAMPEVATA